MEIAFSQTTTEFINHLKTRKRAHATIVAYSKDIDQLVEFLGQQNKMTLNQAKTQDLNDFLQKLGKEGYTPKSISRKINSIKTFYRFVRSQGYLEDDPAAEIVHPKYEITPPRILSKLEYRALRDACRDDIRMSAIVELFLQTGIRIGELAELTLDDVSETSLHIAPHESHAERSVPLNKAAKQSLDNYLKTRPKTTSQTLFITKTGRPLLIRNIRTALDRYFKIAGIEKAKVNDLRHTFIVHHLIAGTPLNIISKLVGHKRLSTTEKYLNFVKGRADDKVRLEEL